MRAPELRAHGLELGRATRARATTEEPAREGHGGLRGAATATEPPRLGRAVRPIWAHQGSTTARSSAFGLTASCCRWNQPIDFFGSPQPTTMVRTALMLCLWTTESLANPSLGDRGKRTEPRGSRASGPRLMGMRIWARHLQRGTQTDARHPDHNLKTSAVALAAEDAHPHVPSTHRALHSWPGFADTRE